MRTRKRMIATGVSLALLTGLAGAGVGAAASSTPPASAAAMAASAVSASASKPAPSPTKTPPSSPTPIPPFFSHDLARILHISVTRAEHVFDVIQQIEAFGNRNFDSDPRFTALAAGLHITPQQLVDALVRVKQDYGNTLPRPPVGKSAPAPGKG
jgi:hypothetical protein